MVTLRRLAFVPLLVGALTATPPVAATCAGDCDGDGLVSSGEVSSAAAVLMGRASLGSCGLGDANRDGLVTVSELLPALPLAGSACPTIFGIMGQVVDVDTGSPVASADITLGSGERGTTDVNGFFSFPDLPAVDVIVHVTAPGYAPGTRAMTPAPGGGDIAIVDLKMLAEPESVDAATGGKVGTSSAASVTFPAQAFVTGDGSAPTEPVDVTITKLDPLGADAGASPGSFADVEGAGAMDSLGIAQVSLASGGEEVALAAGKVATISMPVPEAQAASMSPGEEVPLWGFDETTGKWAPAAQPGTVAEVDGALVVQAPVSHFSWWSFGRSFPSITCITVAVTSAGVPLPGLVVRARGIGFGWLTAGLTDADGRACLPVVADRDYQLQVRLGGVAFHDLGQVTSPSGLGACGVTECAAAGSYDVPFVSCVKGRVTTSTGIPVPHARVIVVPGETVTTDAAGNYCSRTAPGRTVRVTTRGYAGVSVRTPDAATCASGTCVQADLRTEIGAGPISMGRVIAEWRRHYQKLSAQAPLQIIEGPQLSGNFTIPNDPPPGSIVTLDSDTTVGECRVLERVWEKVYVGQANTLEPFSGIVLDPGNPGTMTETSTGTQVLLERGNPWWNAPEVDWFLAGWFTNMTNDGIEAFTDDVDVTVAFPGGRDIGPFSATRHVPEAVTVTEPDFAAADPFMPRDAPMTVRWVPATVPRGPITVELGRGGTQQTMTPEGWPRVRTDLLNVQCTTADDGELVVPQAITSRLPGGTLLIVRRTNVTRIPAIDRRTGRSANVIFETTSRASRTLPGRSVQP